MEPSFELKERDGCICGLTPELSGAKGVRLDDLLGPEPLDDGLTGRCDLHYCPRYSGLHLWLKPL